ncbi:hypothetical protein ACFX2F_043764 [Malus domestica]
MAVERKSCCPSLLHAIFYTLGAMLGFDNGYPLGSSPYSSTEMSFVPSRCSKSTPKQDQNFASKVLPPFESSNFGTCRSRPIVLTA